LTACHMFLEWKPSEPETFSLSRICFGSLIAEESLNLEIVEKNEFILIKFSRSTHVVFACTTKITRLLFLR